MAIRKGNGHDRAAREAALLEQAAEYLRKKGVILAQIEHAGFLRQLHLQEESRTKWRPIILVVACTVPLIILSCLGYGLWTTKLSDYKETVQIALISGSLLTFVVVYSFAIKGLFSMPTDTGKVDELLRKIKLDPNGE